MSAFAQSKVYFKHLFGVPSKFQENSNDTDKQRAKFGSGANCG